MSRIVQTTPMKVRTSAGIRRLAAQVVQTFPDMSVHDHLTDAARELDSGRTEGARRHLNAAIEGFAPLQIIRHGVHDDQGHMAAKLYMQQAYRHLLNVRDIEDVRQANDGLAAERRAAALALKGTAMSPSSQPVPVGAPNGAAGPVAAAPAVAPQAQHLKALSWEDIDTAIELVGLRGYSHGWVFHGVPGSQEHADVLDRMGSAAVDGSPADAGLIHDAALAARQGRYSDAVRNLNSAREGTRNKHLARALGDHSKMMQDAAAHRPDRSRIRDLETGLGMKPAGDMRGIMKSMGDNALKDAIFGSGDRDVVSAAQDEFLKRLSARKTRATAGAGSINFATYAGAKPGSGKNFSKLKGALAKRGATNPGALAAWIGRRKYGRKGFAKLSHGGSSHSWGDVLDAIELVGPKGYSHGWVYHGTPTTRAGMINHLAHGHEQGLPTGRTGYQRETRSFEDFQKVHEEMHRMNPGQNHTHEPAGTAAIRPATVTAGRHYGTGVSSVRDFEALASMPAFSPAESRMLGIADPAYYEKIKAGIQATIQASWEDLDRAILLSAETGRLATEPHPFGKPGGPGLWGVKGMELPPYIQNIARALLRTGRAKTLSQAIAIARGASKRWAAGGGNVRPEVRAASQATGADWNAKQARAHAHANDTWSTLDRAIELAGFNPAQPRTPVGTWGSGGAPAAGGKAQSKQQLQAQIKADRAKLKVLSAQLAKLTTIRHKTTAAAQKAAATGKTAAATPARKGAPAKRGPAGRKAPTRAQLIISIRGQIKQLTAQIAADQKKLVHMSNPLDGLLLAS